jgi:hypothetical protein
VKEQKPMGLFRDSKVDEIVSAEQDLAAAVRQHGERSGLAIQARGRVFAARSGGTVAENMQASHEVATGDRSGRKVGPRPATGYRSLRRSLP